MIVEIFTNKNYHRKRNQFFYNKYVDIVTDNNGIIKKALLFFG